MNIQEIKDEAKKCLNCKNPNCVKACPLNMEIPTFINYVCNNELEKAYKAIVEKNYMGYICGTVCPHEKQCQGNCIKGIKGEPVQIGKIEAAVCEYGLENFANEFNMPQITKEKIAVIGGGPSGITCAFELRKMGYDVTIFERNDYIGGILIYGIPEYRLSKEMVNKIIDNIIKNNINVETGITYGIDETSETLFQKGFKAIYLAIGNEKSKILDIPGNDLEGVYGANEFLKDNINCENKKVIVIGGGNVAMDAARVAKRNNAKEVTIVYRKRLENMPANKIEINEAMEEKINFIFEKNVVKINGESRVENVLCDDNSVIEIDTVIMAIGAIPNREVLGNIEYVDDGLVNINEEFMTNVDLVFAGGDLVQNKSTVCMAIKNGKEAALAIDKKLSLVN
ncbi:MAG: FAD-dependent oxidoreductase [Clostridia bacterium]|nr:FAD-dependent oxidoreductase [Clostridia bacterium]